jgi:hypothetical protein
MKIIAVEMSTVSGQKVRLELDVPVDEELKGFEFSRWLHHFWTQYGQYLDTPQPSAVELVDDATRAYHRVCASHPRTAAEDVELRQSF